MVNSKKRILLITSRSDTGGGPKQVHEILSHLGDRFLFFTAAPSDGEFAPHFKKFSYEVLPLPHRRFSIKSFFSLLKFIKRNEIELIHSHGFGAGIYGGVLSLLGHKVIHTFHGLHLKNDRKSRLKIFLERFFSLSRIEHICVSQSEKTKAKNIGIPSIVIPNGISKKVQTRTKDNLNWPPKVAGVLSRFDPHKNVTWVLSNFSLFELKYPSLELVIAGDGEEQDRISKLANATDTHVLPPQDTYDFFNRIDLLICPSLGEGLPYTVLEAMAYGLPIAASDVPGHNDLLPENCLFRLEPASLVKLNPKDSLSELKELIQQKYTLEENLCRLGDLYAKS